MGYLDTVLRDAPSEFWTLEGPSVGGSYYGAVGNRSLAAAPTVNAAVTTLCPTRPACPEFLGGNLAGLDDNIYSTHAGASGTISVELVFSANSAATATQMMFTKGNGSNYEWDLRLNAGVPEWYVFTSAGSDILHILGGSALSANTVYHMIATYDRAASQGFIYLDGVSRGTPTWAAGNSSNGSAVPMVGKRADSGGNSFSGKIGYIAVYPIALSAATALRHSQMLRREGVVTSG